MKNCLLLVMFAACGTAKTAPSKTTLQPVSGSEGLFQYRDASGAGVQRQVFVESLPGGYERLLAVEWPSDPTDKVMQRSIFDQRFAPSELADLAAAQANLEQEVEVSAEVAFPAASQDSQVWVATASWTTQAENDYATWVGANASANMFLGSGVSVDCADAAELIRWSYAHDHGLPVGNSLAGSGKLFGNWSMQTAWKSLATDPDWHKDQRFLAAFRYLQNNMYTHSLETDLYPTELSRDFITTGSIHLMYEGATGHTETFMHIAPEGLSTCATDGNCMQTVWGNEPPADQLYTSELIGMIGEAQGQGGFLRHRWPVESNGVWKLTAASAMPGYSLDQFQYASDDYYDFLTMVYGKLDIVLSPLARAQIGVSTLAQLIYQRFDVTLNGYLQCALDTCATTDPLYNDYSTPVRDARIVAAGAALQAILPQLDPSDAATLTSNYAYPMIDGMPNVSDYIVDVGGLLEKLSSNPNDDFFTRWAVTLTDPDATFSAYTSLAEMLFTYSRYMLVYTAQQACFPSGGTTATCSHTAASITALSTTRFDYSYRLLASKVLTLQAAASSAEEQSIQTRENAIEAEYVGLCPSQPDSDCTMADYLFGSAGLLQKMTSNPWDSLSKRYGGP